MDELIRPPASGTAPDREVTEHIDPLLSRRIETRPWELRSAQYRAWALAEMAFGGRVNASLVGRPGYPTFRGILYMTIPFRDLDDHETRQSIFLRWAGADPVLGRIPLVFVFEPAPLSVP